MHHSGGVADARHVPRLESVLASESRHEMRKILLVVLQSSSPAVKAELVRGAKALKTLEAWVGDTLEPPSPGHGAGLAGAAPPSEEEREALLLAVVSCLDSLPMDLQTLRRTGIGRVVGNLRKQGMERLAVVAKQLVEKWRQLANSQDDGSAGGDGGTGKKRCADRCVDRSVGDVWADVRVDEWWAVLGLGMAGNGNISEWPEWVARRRFDCARRDGVVRWPQA